MLKHTNCCHILSFINNFNSNISILSPNIVPFNYNIIQLADVLKIKFILNVVLYFLLLFEHNLEFNFDFMLELIFCRVAQKLLNCNMDYH
jgi:hypothetical protein